MLHMAVKVERQQRRRPIPRGNPQTNSRFNSVNTSRWNNTNNNRKSTPLQIREPVEVPKPKQPPPPEVDKSKGKQKADQPKARDVQCFKCLGRGHYSNECPNRRNILMMYNGEYESDSEKETEESPCIPEEEVEDDDADSDSVLSLVVK